jgi:hypothetical protein
MGFKRGEGKHKGDVKKYDFYSYYRKNTKFPKLERKEYSAFLKDLLTAFSEAIVRENMELKLGKLGFIRVQAKKLHFFDKDGNRAKTLKVNWQKTWEYWESKYEGKTRDEIKQIKDKTVLFHENDHTNGEFYQHLWDKLTSIVKYRGLYQFIPSRQYSRLITEMVSDPHRTVFYYG